MGRQARNASQPGHHGGEDSTKASTSSSLVDQPTDRRSECSASTPMASRTGEGASDSDEHDEPEWAAMPLLIETEQDGLGFDAVDGHADDVRDPGLGVAHAVDPVDRRRRLQQSARLPPGRGSASASSTPVAPTDLGGGAETDDGGDVLEAGPPGPFLFAADQQGIEAQSPAHDQGADPRAGRPICGR